VKDHHKKQRKSWLKMESKRQRALETLGVKWVLHKDNPKKIERGIYNNFGLRMA